LTLAPTWDPRARWLPGCGVAFDSYGFVLTVQAAGFAAGHVPPPLQSSVTRLFAVGDVRAGSVNVGGAIGEGAAAALVDQYLAAAWRRMHRRLANVNSNS
jgi:thioredoxin reductase (NADPH)